MEHPNPFLQLSRLLSYPGSGTKPVMLKTFNELVSDFPEQAAVLAEFTRFVESTSEEKLQELYTHTFEVQALCQLDLGYVLFGEDYKRGQFLVHLKLEHLKVHNECGTELPDHLTNILNLLPKLRDASFAAELVHTFVLPGVDKMLASFKENGNVYRGVLVSIREILAAKFPEIPSLDALPGGMR